MSASSHTMKDSYPFYLAGLPVDDGEFLPVTDKFSGQAISRVRLADAGAMATAIGAATDAAHEMRRMPAHRRQAILQHIVQRLHERAEEFAQIMCIEAGKPIKDARVEVSRAIDTFRIASEEAVRTVGELLPLDTSPRAKGYEGFVRRVPIGPCSFITPFNFPLNLLAHKVAPALAMGCPFVLKPAPQTPITAIMLGEILAACELPQGAFSIVPCTVETAAALVEDERLKLLSFTGSTAVGWMLKSRAGKKKVVLELGGNAACVVDQGADLDFAIPRIVFGAFYQSGQSCISVQRLLVHETLYAGVRDRLAHEAQQLKMGDPRDESTFLGPLISENDAQRVEIWVHEAVNGGASVLCGGKRSGRFFYEATIVENVPRTAKLNCEEVFGPVMSIESFSDFADACRIVNESRYGLQAGVFTRELAHAHYAWNELEVGGVIINDIPSMRIESMPYGGVKDSGLGREGVRYAMQEMSELRSMVVRNG